MFRPYLGQSPAPPRGRAGLEVFRLGGRSEYYLFGKSGQMLLAFSIWPDGRREDYITYGTPKGAK